MENNETFTPPVQFAPLYREPAAARITYRLIWLNFLQALLMVGLAGIAVFLYLRRPERVVIKESATGEQLLLIDNRSYGEVANLALQPDQPTNGQKLFAAKEFAGLLYQVDASTRNQAVRRALGMMIPSAANQFYQYLLKNNGNANNSAGLALNVERAENWAATFAVKDATLDARDPNVVNLVGEQKITKNLNGTASETTRLVQVSLKLHPDPNRRTDANLQTGWQVHSFTFKELPR